LRRIEDFIEESFHFRGIRHAALFKRCLGLRVGLSVEKTVPGAFHLHVLHLLTGRFQSFGVCAV
jgi:hypothetical protein